MTSQEFQKFLMQCHLFHLQAVALQAVLASIRFEILVLYHHRHQQILIIQVRVEIQKRVEEIKRKNHHHQNVANHVSFQPVQLPIMNRLSVVRETPDVDHQINHVISHRHLYHHYHPHQHQEHHQHHHYQRNQ
jgi:hypothetical protein